MKNIIKTLLIITISILLLPSCVPEQSTSNKFEKMEPPIILIAKSKKGTIIIQDANNENLTISYQYSIAQAISNSYNTGDTLKYLNK